MYEMKNKSFTYDYFKKYTNDKNVSVQYLIDNYLIKTKSMFIYRGLPETLPQNELENLLQTEGKCFITKHEGDLVALRGTEQGDRDIYGNLKSFLVINPYVNLNKTYDLKTEGVLIKNDFKGIGLLPTIGMYATLLTDTKISLNLADMLTRMMLIISASDDITKESADDFLKKIQEGEMSVIGESSFFDGVTTHNGGTTNSSIKPIIELSQYYKANLMNELGLNANFNMKRERLNESEIGLNIDGLLPFTHSMLHERREAIQKINEMFELSITVDFDSAWKIEHETADQITERIDTVSVEETEQIEPIEPIEQIEPIEPIEPIETIEPIEEEIEPIEEEIEPIEEEIEPIETIKEEEEEEKIKK